MDMKFLVSRMYETQTNYLSYHSATLPGGGASSKEERTPLNFAGFGSPNHSGFYKENYSRGGECRGLLYFDRLEHNGKILICNPTTEEMKFLPPSLHLRVSGVFRPSDDYRPCASGFGYDETSKDFKIVRILSRRDQKEVGDGILPDIVLGVAAEMYSFNTNSWKEINSPDHEGLWDITNPIAQNVNGKLYWAAAIFEGQAMVLSFDFATELFSTFLLPLQSVQSDEIHRRQNVFQLDSGNLGVFEYGGHCDKTIQIWEWEKESWKELHNITLVDGVYVVKPLYLKHDLLFFEGSLKPQLIDDDDDDDDDFFENMEDDSPPVNELMVCDLKTMEVEQLGVFDYELMLRVFPNTPSTYCLPKDAVPIPEIPEAGYE